MLIEQQIKYYKKLDNWFTTPLGLFVAQEFKKKLDEIKSSLKGDVLLQIGSAGANTWLSNLNYLQKYLAMPAYGNHHSNLVCSLNQLPLQRNSVDCVIAPVSLEPFNHRFTLIDEIDRVLKPMGYVVILGINPWSLWGIPIQLGLLESAVSSMKVRSASYMNRLWRQRGYTLHALNYFCYIPPLNHSDWIERFKFFEAMGKMLWPFPSGLYLYVAQKNEYALSSSQLISAYAVNAYKIPLHALTN